MRKSKSKSTDAIKDLIYIMMSRISRPYFLKKTLLTLTLDFLVLNESTNSITTPMESFSGGLYTLSVDTTIIEV